MATASAYVKTGFRSLGQSRLFTIFKIKELRQKILITVLFLTIYRIGFHVPLPMIDQNEMAKTMRSSEDGLFSMISMFSGGSLSQSTIFGLGIMPYISASIILQMGTHIIPSLGQLRKEGESGRRKITQYTRYGTVILSTFQSVAAASALQTQGVVLNPGPAFVVTAAVTLVTGTMFLMWLGEQITERGLGNGISILIFAGIVAGLPNAIGGLFELVRTGSINPLSAIVVVVLIAVVTGVVVFVACKRPREIVSARRLLPAATSVLVLVGLASLLILPQIRWQETAKRANEQRIKFLGDLLLRTKGRFRFR